MTAPLSLPPQELELVEDVWRGEAQDLLSQIAQLQEENKQLMTNLSHKDAGFSEEEFQKHEGEARCRLAHPCSVGSWGPGLLRPLWLPPVPDPRTP